MKVKTEFGSASRQTYHHGDLRATLLNTATDLLKERGLESLTLRQIARRAGVSHSAPSRHFESLQALLTELAIQAFNDLVASMDAASEKNTTQDALEGAGLGYISFAIKKPELFRLMFRVEYLDSTSPALQAAKVPALERLFKALSNAYAREHGFPIASEKLMTRVSLAWSAVHGYAAIWVDEKNAKGILADSQSVLDALRPALLAK